LTEQEWIHKVFDRNKALMENWTKEEASAHLVKLGIYNSDGTLHENYGGVNHEI